MPSAVYLHDGEHQITVTFRTEEDRERFKAHYRALDALAARYRDALVAERERTRVLREALETVRPCLMDAMRYGGGRYGKECAVMDAALLAEMDREEGR